jgi:hypothetical protein
LPNVSRTVKARVLDDYRWSWVAGASTLALGGAALGTHMRSLDEARKVEARCPGSCDPWAGETTRRDTLNRLSDGLVISALVLSVATIVIVLVEHQFAVEREAASRKHAQAQLR